MTHEQAEALKKGDRIFKVYPHGVEPQLQEYEVVGGGDVYAPVRRVRKGVIGGKPIREMRYRMQVYALNALDALDAFAAFSKASLEGAREALASAERADADNQQWISEQRAKRGAQYDFPRDADGGYAPCPICGRRMCDHTLDERGDGVRGG